MDGMYGKNNGDRSKAWELFSQQYCVLDSVIIDARNGMELRYSPMYAYALNKK